MSELSNTPMKGGSDIPDSAGKLSVSLYQQFGSFQLAVEFRVPLGLIVLFGPSGAGKSLTLRGLAGLLHPKAGHVVVDGHLLFESMAGIDLPPQERRIGYVPQHYALFPHLTVAENVRFALPRRSQRVYTGKFLQERSQSGGGTEGSQSGEETEGTRKGPHVLPEPPLPLQALMTGRLVQEGNQSSGGTEGTRKEPHILPQPPLPLQALMTGRLVQEGNQSSGGTEGTRKGPHVHPEPPLPLQALMTERLVQEGNQSSGETEGTRKGPHVHPEPPLPLQASIRSGKTPPSVSSHWVPWRKERAMQEVRVAELLAVLGLEGLERRYPATLSGGQQQRVALARALAAEPRLLLLDEPFNALDVAVREHLRDTLKQFQRKFAVPIVLVTHDHAEAQQLADTIVVLQRGRVVQVGSASEVFLAPRTPDIALMVGQRNVFGAHLATLEEEGSSVPPKALDMAGMNKQISQLEEEGSSVPPKALRVDWLQANGAEEYVNIPPDNGQDGAWLPLPATSSFSAPGTEGTFTGCILADEVIVHRWPETVDPLPSWTARGAVLWKGVVLDAQLHGHAVRLLIRPQWVEQPESDILTQDSVLELYLNRSRWREIEVAPGQPVLLEVGPEAIHLFEEGTYSS